MPTARGRTRFRTFPILSAALSAEEIQSPAFKQATAGCGQTLANETNFG